MAPGSVAGPSSDTAWRCPPRKISSVPAGISGTSTPGWVSRMRYVVFNRQQAQAIDALFPPLSFVWTIVRLFRREFDAAVVCGKNTVDLHPSSQIGRTDYALALELAGRPAEALAQYRLASAMAP